MVKQAVGILLAVGVVTGVSAHEPDFLARFQGGIGVIPASNGAGTANADGTFPNVKLNVVRGISPGAGPWRIADLRADVDLDGHIRVKGRGLLLASSNSIGQNANQRVFATLFCEAAAPFVELGLASCFSFLRGASDAVDLVTTAPGVLYRVTTTDGVVQEIDSPAKLPDPGRIKTIEEPVITAMILTPAEHVGGILQLCQDKRGIQKALEYLASDRVLITYDLPFNEVVLDFYDKLKTISRGYASLDYHVTGYWPSPLVKLDILVNGDPVDALSIIVHKDMAYERGRLLASKMRELIPRQMFEIAIQAAIGGRIIARESVKALRKNVLAKCYGGDISRKRKLLEKQKEGKRRMKQIGTVEVPQEAFLAVLKVEGTNLVPARFGNSDEVEPGEWVLALGNPFGLEPGEVVHRQRIRVVVVQQQPARRRYIAQCHTHQPGVHFHQRQPGIQSARIGRRRVGRFPSDHSTHQCGHRDAFRECQGRRTDR
jgi:hypothetical protein